MHRRFVDKRNNRKRLRRLARQGDRLSARSRALFLLSQQPGQADLRALQAVLGDHRQPLRLRYEAAAALGQSDSVKALRMLEKQLRRESHPRIVEMLLIALRRHGDQRSWKQVQAYLQGTEPPAPLRRQAIFSELLLRFRHGGPGEPLPDLSLPDLPPHLVCPAANILPAPGPMFQAAWRVCQATLPAIAISNAYGLILQGSRGDALLLFSQDFQEAASLQYLTERTTLLGVVLTRPARDQPFRLGYWLLSQPDGSRCARLLVHATDGSRGYQGRMAVRKKQILAFIHTEPTSHRAPLQLRLAYRKNQLIHGTVYQPLAERKQLPPPARMA